MAVETARVSLYMLAEERVEINAMFARMLARRTREPGDLSAGLVIAGVYEKRGLAPAFGCKVTESQDARLHHEGDEFLFVWFHK